MKSLHTCVRVQDLEKSVEFYKDAFGFEETKRLDYPDAKFTLVYMALPGEDYELELTYNYDHEPYDLGNGYGHIALGTENLAEKHQELLDKGYNVTDLTGLSDGAANYFFIIDPDGYKIEVIQLWVK